MKYCRICKKPNCREHAFIFKNVRKITKFSGSSPPEIFVGRWDYPNVYAGILSPKEYGNTELLSSQELWHQNKLDMQKIVNLRGRLIYGRAKTNVKRAFEKDSKFLSTMQEIAMASKSTAAEFRLSKPLIEKNKEMDSFIPIIKNAALVESVRLEENPHIEKKVDYLANDSDVKARVAILELEKANIKTSMIIKLLSAGLLGCRRKLVPTRWAITCIDDTLSKEKLKSIRDYQEIEEIFLFNAEYLGNHYEFLLLPEKWSFEVIEINSQNFSCWHDHESFFPRKTYAENVTGAYYSNRLAVCEYLEKIKKQASCIVFREINPEIYTQSMGVGILRQISREAFSNQPEKFENLNEAIERIQTRIKLPVKMFAEKSEVLNNYHKQTRIERWL